jgi:hypothetical protein
MYTVTEIITPEKAEEYLKHNGTNRPKKTRAIKTYADAMKEGKWQLTHQGIAFKSNGELADGQNRLRAVILANVPVQMNVTYGMDATLLDRGVMRSQRDTLIMNGLESGSVQLTSIGAINFLFSYAYGTTPGDSILVDFFEEYGDEVSKANLISSTVYEGRAITRRSAVVAATFCALVCGVNAGGLKEFFQIVNSGFTTDEKMSAAIVLRNFIKDDYISRRGDDNEKLFVITTLSIDDAMRGKSRMTRYRKTDSPKFFPYVKEEILNRYHKR